MKTLKELVGCDKSFETPEALKSVADDLSRLSEFDLLHSVHIVDAGAKIPNAQTRKSLAQYELNRRNMAASERLTWRVTLASAALGAFGTLLGVVVGWSLGS